MRVAAFAEVIDIGYEHLFAHHCQSASGGHLQIVEIAAAAGYGVGKRQFQHLIARAVCRQGEAIACTVGCRALIIFGGEYTFGDALI